MCPVKCSDEFNLITYSKPYCRVTDEKIYESDTQNK